ncbi:hypothetical protein L7F22_013960 [Adiantum nelumboides]|nr:hypothetical protein [Adiantum nelumboides]
MGVPREAVMATLNDKLKPVYLNVVDTSDGYVCNLAFTTCNRPSSIVTLNISVCRCGASFLVEVVSSAFEGKRLLERNRLVFAALAEEMKQIHALSLKKP